MRRGFRMSPDEGDALYELEKDRAQDRRDRGTTLEEENAVDDRLDTANDEAEDDEWADWLDEEDD